MAEKEIVKIVLTGGPCSGKTTGLLYLEEKLADQGFSVFKVQEMATFIDSCGVRLGKLAREDPKQYIKAQELLAKLIVQFEDHLQAFVEGFPGDKKVMICDRGLMDAKGYMPHNRFKGVLNCLKLDPVQARDARYHGVIHLVTAAQGAEKYYSVEGHPSRYESPTEARLVDKRVQEAWLGHPHLTIIDNSTGFKMKMKRLRQAAARILGIPAPLEIERKFLIDPGFSPRDIGVPCQKISIEQCYLPLEKGKEVRIRQRGQKGCFAYYLTKKQSFGRPGVRIETEMQISSDEYFALRKSIDRTKKIIRKNRFCFIWENQYLELDIFWKPYPLILLEVELTEENQEVSLPPFLLVLKEVTDDDAFSNYQIASKNP